MDHQANSPTSINSQTSSYSVFQSTIQITVWKGHFRHRLIEERIQDQWADWWQCSKGQDKQQQFSKTARSIIKKGNGEEVKDLDRTKTISQITAHNTERSQRLTYCHIKVSDTSVEGTEKVESKDNNYPILPKDRSQELESWARTLIIQNNPIAVLMVGTLPMQNSVPIASFVAVMSTSLQAALKRNRNNNHRETTISH